MGDASLRPDSLPPFFFPALTKREEYATIMMMLQKGQCWRSIALLFLSLASCGSVSPISRPAALLFPFFPPDGRRKKKKEMPNLYSFLILLFFFLSFFPLFPLPALGTKESEESVAVGQPPLRETFFSSRFFPLPFPSMHFLSIRMIVAYSDRLSAPYNLWSRVAVRLSVPFFFFFSLPPPPFTCDFPLKCKATRLQLVSVEC